MEVSFDADINLDDDNSHSNDDCELHNDYDNQKLFDIYESYLDKSDTDSEPELSFDDQFYEVVANKVGKTPVANRQTISCLADIESRTPRKSRKSFAAEECDQTFDESMSEISLPWNLKEMTEQQIIDLAKTLEEQILNNEMEVPKVAANHIKEIFDKQIEFLNQLFDESENNFQNCLKNIDLKCDQRIDFNEVIAEEFKTIKSNSEKLTKLLFELKVIKEISEK